jgi:hypothetical protein
MTYLGLQQEYALVHWETTGLFLAAATKPDCAFLALTINSQQAHCAN